MIVEVVERPVVAYCSTVLRWAELNLKSTEVKSKWTDDSESRYCLYNAKNRFTGQLLLAPNEPRTTISNFGFSHSHFFAPTYRRPNRTVSIKSWLWGACKSLPSFALLQPPTSIPSRVDFYDTSKRPLRWGHWLIAQAHCHSRKERETRQTDEWKKERSEKDIGARETEEYERESRETGVWAREERERQKSDWYRGAREREEQERQGYRGKLITQ